jgi:hypothetical protein
MADPIFIQRSARSLKAVGIIVLWWVFLAILWLAFDAHPLILAGLAGISLFAVADVLRNRAVWFELDDSHMRWESGGQSGEIALPDIDHAILSTTLDFSQRAVIHTLDRKKHRLPQECLPAGRALDKALEARGIKHRRSVFSF